METYDNFFLPVDEMDKAKQFYEKLGLTKKFDFSDKGMVAYSVGKEEPAIILKDKKKFPTAKPTIWFVVNDTKKTYEKLTQAGIHFLTKPFQIGTGMSAEFEDPFGNRLGITDYSKEI